MSDLETTINFLQEDKTMTVFTSQRKWLNKLLKYAHEKDSNVIITHKIQMALQCLKFLLVG